MSRAQLIQPKSLQSKLGKLGPIDAEALARAEAALKSLSSQFQGWMEDEVAKLEAARDAARTKGWDLAALGSVYGASHDAKGMGSTYEYPLVTELAASLCKLLETDETREKALNAIPVINAHVDAMRAAVRGQIKTTDHPVGAALLAELRARVEAILA
jgi:hypothetical protein